MSDYTPTTGAVRTDYANVAQFGLDMTEHRYAEFDRWLAEVKAQAWQEGYNAKWAETWFEDNPYRQGENK